MLPKTYEFGLVACLSCCCYCCCLQARVWDLNNGACLCELKVGWGLCVCATAYWVCGVVCRWSHLTTGTSSILYPTLGAPSTTLPYPSSHGRPYPILP